MLLGVVESYLIETSCLEAVSSLLLILCLLLTTSSSCHSPTHQSHAVAKSKKLIHGVITICAALSMVKSIDNQEVLDRWATHTPFVIYLTNTITCCLMLAGSVLIYNVIDVQYRINKAPTPAALRWMLALLSFANFVVILTNTALAEARGEQLYHIYLLSYMVASLTVLLLIADVSVWKIRALVMHFEDRSRQHALNRGVKNKHLYPLYVFILFLNVLVMIVMAALLYQAIHIDISGKRHSPPDRADPQHWRIDIFAWVQIVAITVFIWWSWVPIYVCRGCVDVLSSLLSILDLANAQQKHGRVAEGEMTHVVGRASGQGTVASLHALDASDSQGLLGQAAAMAGGAGGSSKQWSQPGTPREGNSSMQWAQQTAASPIHGPIGKESAQNSARTSANNNNIRAPNPRRLSLHHSSRRASGSFNKTSFRLQTPPLHPLTHPTTAASSTNTSNDTISSTLTISTRPAQLSASGSASTIVVGSTVNSTNGSTNTSSNGFHTPGTCNGHLTVTPNPALGTAPNQGSSSSLLGGRASPFLSRQRLLHTPAGAGAGTVSAGSSPNLAPLSSMELSPSLYSSSTAAGGSNGNASPGTTLPPLVPLGRGTRLGLGSAGSTNGNNGLTIIGVASAAASGTTTDSTNNNGNGNGNNEGNAALPRTGSGTDGHRSDMVTQPGQLMAPDHPPVSSREHRAPTPRSKTQNHNHANADTIFSPSHAKDATPNGRSSRTASLKSPSNRIHPSPSNAAMSPTAQPAPAASPETSSIPLPSPPQLHPVDSRLHGHQPSSHPHPHPHPHPRPPAHITSFQSDDIGGVREVIVGGMVVDDSQGERASSDDIPGVIKDADSPSRKYTTEATSPGSRRTSHMQQQQQQQQPSGRTPRPSYSNNNAINGTTASSGSPLHANHTHSARGLVAPSPRPRPASTILEAQS